MCVNIPFGPQLQMFEEEECSFAGAYGSGGGPANDRLVLIWRFEGSCRDQLQQQLFHLCQFIPDQVATVLLKWLKLPVKMTSLGFTMATASINNFFFFFTFLDNNAPFV